MNSSRIIIHHDTGNLFNENTDLLQKFTESVANGWCEEWEDFDTYAECCVDDYDHIRTALNCIRYTLNGHKEDYAYTYVGESGYEGECMDFRDTEEDVQSDFFSNVLTKIVEFAKAAEDALSAKCNEGEDEYEAKTHNMLSSYCEYTKQNLLYIKEIASSFTNSDPLKVKFLHILIPITSNQTGVSSF